MRYIAITVILSLLSLTFAYAGPSSDKKVVLSCHSDFGHSLDLVVMGNNIFEFSIRNRDGDRLEVSTHQLVFKQDQEGKIFLANIDRNNTGIEVRVDNLLEDSYHLQFTYFNRYEDSLYFFSKCESK